MSVQLQKMRFAAVVAGLAIIAAVALEPAVVKTVHATQSPADCQKPLSIQEQATCNEELRTSESGFGTVVAWLFPSTDGEITKTGATLPVKGEKKPAKGALTSNSLSTTGLMLFGAAFIGIVYLGRRRRKTQTREK